MKFTHLTCCFLILVISSCENVEKTDTKDDTLLSELKDSDKKQLRAKSDSIKRIKRDSINQLHWKDYWNEVSKIPNQNGLTGISLERLNFLLDSLNTLNLPIGDKESFYYDYPGSFEAEYGLADESSYLKDSIAYSLSEKAFKSFQVSVNETMKENRIYELELFLDSTKVKQKEGLRLSFIGILEKKKNFSTLVYCCGMPFAYSLITIDSKGKIIDIQGVCEHSGFPPSDSIFTSDLIFIDNERIVHVKQFIVYATTQSTHDYLSYKTYKTNEAGNILRYFDEENGTHETTVSSTSYKLEYAEFEKGQIVNHRKHGEWKELNTEYGNYRGNFRQYWKIPLLVEANYQNGVRDGSWEYFEFQRDTFMNDNGEKVIEFKKLNEEPKYKFVYQNGVIISEK